MKYHHALFSSDSHQDKSLRHKKVDQLKEPYKQYIYMEASRKKSLLGTETLKNLANNFRDKLPRVVSIVAKGAGKTFIYLHLSRFKYWENFLQHSGFTLESLQETHIFPLLQPHDLQDEAKNICNEARKGIRDILDLPEFSHSEIMGRIQEKINARESDDWSEPDWEEFWISQIAQSLGIETNSLLALDRELKAKSLKVIFLFDGLEDTLAGIASNEKLKKALKALIDNLPRQLSEIRQANLGIIVFLCRDCLRSTIIQNVQQFEAKYSAYNLF